MLAGVRRVIDTDDSLVDIALRQCARMTAFAWPRLLLMPFLVEHAGAFEQLGAGRPRRFGRVSLGTGVYTRPLTSSAPSVNVALTSVDW